MGRRRIVSSWQFSGVEPLGRVEWQIPRRYALFLKRGLWYGAGGNQPHYWIA